MFANLGHYAWLVAQLFTGCTLLLPAALLIRYACFRKENYESQEELFEEKDYAVVVLDNGNQNTISLIHSLLKLQYTNYLIYLVSDQPGLKHLALLSNRIIVIKPTVAFENKATLYRHVVEIFHRPHTHITILTGDCSVRADYLQKLNIFFHRGYQAVQAKVGGSHRFFLQSLCSDVLFLAGSSAALQSTGMAVNTSLFKQCLKANDKQRANFHNGLTYQIINRGHVIASAFDAVVTPEINKAELSFLSFEKSSVKSFYFLPASFRLFVKGIGKGSQNQVLAGLRMLWNLLILISTFIMCVSIMKGQISPSMALFWMMACGASATCLAYFFRRENKERNSHFMLENHGFMTERFEKESTQRKSFQKLAQAVIE